MLEGELAQMDILINALRRLVGDEQKCNEAIMKEV